MRIELSHGEEGGGDRKTTVDGIGSTLKDGSKKYHIKLGLLIGANRGQKDKVS